MMALDGRSLTAVLAFLIVAFEVAFLFLADYHIAAQPRHDGGINGLRRPGEPADRRPDQPRWRRKTYTFGGRKVAPSTHHHQYKPDYSRFNTSFPPVIYASSPGSLSSVPDANRIPRDIAADRSDYYIEDFDPNIFPHLLFAYNPSLVSLHPPDWSPPEDLGGTERRRQSRAIEENRIRYLSTFRVSSVHSCGFRTYEFWNYPVDYLGLGLMTDELKVFRSWDNKGFDIVVDVNEHLPKIYGARMKFQDVRLFTLHDRVYMSSGVFLVPICVRLDWSSSAEKEMRSSHVFCKKGDEEYVVEIPAMRPSYDARGGLSSKGPYSPSSASSPMRLYVTGDAIRLKDVEGKNFQFFHAGDSSGRLTNDVLMEYWPAGPRLVHDLGTGIELLHSKRTAKKRVVNLTRTKEVKSEVAPDPQSKVALSLDASLKTFIKRDRSSACCVRIERSQYEDMLPSLPESSASRLRKLDHFLVGIAHSKSRGRMPSSQEDRYNYLSRTYAFSPVEPYDLLARSGLFCLPFSQTTDAKSSYVGVGNSYNWLTGLKRLELYGKNYACPNIHFVDSMVDKAGDDSRIVVSYGVNDCVPRFAEVSKRDLVVHLFSE